RKLGAICETLEPPLIEAKPGHVIRCHIRAEDLERLQRQYKASVQTAEADLGKFALNQLADEGLQ
ncbi:MAG: hypothetical protein E5V36_27595, partial [Mesorhizobium sp.]